MSASTPNPEHSPGASATLETQKELARKKNDLQSYLKALEHPEKDADTLKQLRKNIDQWNNAWDVTAVRLGGRTEQEEKEASTLNADGTVMNPEKYYRRFILLSQACLQPLPSSDRLKFKVNFRDERGNLIDILQKKVGAGDVIPDNVTEIAVKKAPGNDGPSSIRAIRAIGSSGRIGYFDKEALSKGQEVYIKMFDGDEIEFLETQPLNTSPVQVRHLKEQVALFKQGAATDAHSEKIEQGPPRENQERKLERLERERKEVNSTAKSEVFLLRSQIGFATSFNNRKPDQKNETFPSKVIHRTFESKLPLEQKLRIMLEDHRQNILNTHLLPSEVNRLKKFVEKARSHQAIYEEVSKATGYPWELIAALHERESGGNFKTCLHNGDPLGKPTIHVPKGLTFYTWKESAIDALKRFNTVKNGLGITSSTKDLGMLLTVAELYNGDGYRRQSRALPSAYVYAATDKYEGGKFVQDGQFDKNAWDKQLGVAAMLLALRQSE